ncbi:patatin-like phospholipase family protein [Candidatus Obscuribacterales bacterium]|nr:patatin-like phospholipase family protein [Candidatus Obscuribacterales bacterium]
MAEDEPGAPRGGELEHEQFVRILSIDGGGIRGIIPAIFLSHLEKKLGITESGTERLSDHFDLIAGTSTGGLVAMWLTVPPDERIIPRTATELVDVYEKHGSRIFPNSGTAAKDGDSLPRAWFGYSQSRYPSLGLNDVLKDLFKQQKFGTAKTASKTKDRGMVIVTAYDMTRSIPRQFQSWRDEHSEALVRDIARATSAAPTYFPPKEIIFRQNGSDDPHAFVDGGLFANNPSLTALAEATYLWPNARYLVVSVGTGYSSKRLRYDEIKNWGQAEWLDPLLSSMFHAGSAATHFYLSHLAALPINPQVAYYRRINVRLPKELEAMDNAKNCSKLKECLNTLINKDAQYDDALSELVSVLSRPHASAGIPIVLDDELVHVAESKEPPNYLWQSMSRPRITLLTQILIILPSSSVSIWFLDLCHGTKANVFDFGSVVLPAFVLMGVLHMLMASCFELSETRGTVRRIASFVFHLLLIALLSLVCPKEYALAGICTIMFGLLNFFYIHLPIGFIAYQRTVKNAADNEIGRRLLSQVQAVVTFCSGPITTLFIVWVYFRHPSSIDQVRKIIIITLIYSVCVVVSRAVIHMRRLDASRKCGVDNKQAELVIRPNRSRHLKFDEANDVHARD